MNRSLRGPAAVVVALLLTLVLLVLATGPSTQNDDPSSRVAGRAGTLVLYRWLGRLGFTVHRISGRFDTSASNVLLIADPRTAFGDADTSAVVGALSRGADVILALSPQSRAAAARLLDRLHVTLGGPRAAGDSVPAEPFDASESVHRVPMGAGPSITAAAGLAPLLAQGGALAAVAEPVAGGGRAYVLASSLPLSNDGLRRGDSAAMVLSLLERARGGAIGFDEFHHGEVDVPADGAVAILDSPLGLALLLALVAVVAFLVLGGRRLGRPLPSRDPALVPSTAAYIAAMAGLYARGGNRGAVASRYAEELKQRLVVAGDPWAGEAGDGAFLAAVESSRPDLTGEAGALLARARSLAGADPPAGALLALARDVDDLERRWAEAPAGAGAR